MKKLVQIRKAASKLKIRIEFIKSNRYNSFEFNSSIVPLLRNVSLRQQNDAIQ